MAIYNNTSIYRLLLSLLLLLLSGKMLVSVGLYVLLLLHKHVTYLPLSVLSSGSFA